MVYHFLLSKSTDIPVIFFRFQCINKNLNTTNLKDTKKVDRIFESLLHFEYFFLCTLSFFNYRNQRQYSSVPQFPCLLESGNSSPNHDLQNYVSPNHVLPKTFNPLTFHPISCFTQFMFHSILRLTQFMCRLYYT